MIFRHCLGPFALLALSAPIAIAQETEPPSTSTVYACAEISADDERLACYDSAVGRLKTAEEAGEITTVSRKDVEEVQRESFGFSIPSLPRLALPKLGSSDDADSEISEVTFTATKIDKDPYGKLIVTLENGQVWHQTDSASVYVSKRGDKTTTIKRAALGSFMMKIGNSRSFRAKRQQ